ncbi:pirin family protein [Lacibacterium aquatile]|uniref:Pirin family protein n=1 Tax=Lacibacterium aquatile TaxID=1168082 RepID=A0ABW5DQI0_9PROT
MTAIDLIFDARIRDLGDGFNVRRVLPFAKRRAVGPFVFLDHIGPVQFEPGKGIDVRPHPHIGLATVTYLFEGAQVHRDSTGAVQTIRPGDVNWMTAGSGVTHSERSPEVERAAGHPLYGMQSWVALPQEFAEVAPDFHHHPAATIPVIEKGGARLSLIAGSAYGATSPVKVFSETVYLIGDLAAGASVDLPTAAELAVYIVSGTATVDGTPLVEGQMAVLTASAILASEAGAKVVILGGEPLDGPRTIWWNFVAASPERIEQAKADWKAGSFEKVPGETEFIPLPE